MPRSGKSYPNRSDLRALPKTTVPGQPYGAQAAQKAAMAAVPMANGALPTAEPAGPTMPDFTGHHPDVPSPGSLPPLDAPTARPDEHILTGLQAPRPVMTRPSQVLEALAPHDVNGELADLLNYARQMGL